MPTPRERLPRQILGQNCIRYVYATYGRDPLAGGKPHVSYNISYVNLTGREGKDSLIVKSNESLSRPSAGGDQAGGVTSRYSGLARHVLLFGSTTLPPGFAGFCELAIQIVQSLYATLQSALPFIG